MKKISLLILTTIISISLIAVLSLAGCQAEAAAEEEAAEEAPAEEEVAEEAPVFGNLPVALSDEWGGYSVEAFEYAADLKGVEVEVLDSEWDGEKQLNNLEDLITKGVDELGVFVYTPEAAQDFILRANEAGVPISFENTKLIDRGLEGDFVFNVACEYYDIGYAAMEYISENWPGSKVFYCRGLPGMGIVEEYQKGVDDAIADAGNIELTVSRDTQWDTETAMNATQDVIQAGEEFDVIFANNESMAVGCINALEDAGMADEVKVVSTGGGPTGVEMIENGELDATMASPVSIQGLWLFKAMWFHYNGWEIEEKFVPTPLIPVDKDNLDENISWKVSDFHIDYIGGLDEW